MARLPPGTRSTGDPHGPHRRLVSTAAAFRSRDTGRVRLGSGATACIYLLLPVLAAAKIRMTGLEILVAIGSTPDTLRRVEGGDLDAGFITMPRMASRALMAVSIRRNGFAAPSPGDDAKRGRSRQPNSRRCPQSSASVVATRAG